LNRKKEEKKSLRGIRGSYENMEINKKMTVEYTVTIGL